MRLKQCFAFFFIFSCALATGSAFAAKIYHHVPFVSSIRANDTLIINYDFTEKKGVRCISNGNQLLAEFTYKGRQKSAHVPIVLECARIPDPSRDKEHEELADIHGQFSLNVEKNQIDNNEYLVSCGYVE